jgi:thiamine transport system permease protein
MDRRVEKHLLVMNSVAKTAQWLQVLVVALLALFFAFPVLSMIASYARLQDIVDTLTESSLRGVWWFTLWQAVASTVLTLIVGLPFTWAISRHAFRFSRVLNSLITIPFFMPAVVVATGIKAILPAAGIPAILWAHVVFNVAIVVRIVGPQWSLLDNAMEDTAADLGAGRVRTFFYVVVPHIRESLRNAAAIIFLFCFTSFAVIAVLGDISHRTIESEIFTQAIRLGDTRTATSLALVQAIVVLLVLRWGNPSSHEPRTAPQTIQFFDASRPPRGVVLFSAVALPALVVIAPLVAVVVRSFSLNGHFSVRGYQWLFDGSTEAVGVNIPQTLMTSFFFAILCAVFAPLAALVISVAHRRSSFVIAATALPLAVSAVTFGLGLIIAFDQWPVNWRSQWWLIPVVHSVIALPLAVRAIQPALHAIPEDLSQAASSLGAHPWRSWRFVEFPLLQPALVRAVGLSAAVSLGEFGATSFLTRNDTTTIPIAIAQLLGRPGDLTSQSAFALAALVVMVFALVPQVRRRQ